MSQTTTVTPAGGLQVAAWAADGDEAAELVRRIRRESRLPRVVAVGIVLGAVCSAMAIWPFVHGDRYVVGPMVDAARVSTAGVVASVLLAGLLPLVAFYSLRLHVQSARCSAAVLEVNLLKLRRLVAACMALSLLSVVGVLTQEWTRTLGDIGLAAMYGACAAGCAIIAGDLRRGLGEFDSARQRARRKVVRGFEVDLRPLAAADASAAPVPVRALPLGVLDADGAGDAELGARQYERDLRRLLHALVAAGLVLYAVRVAELPRAIHDASGLNITIFAMSGSMGYRSFMFSFRAWAYVATEACGIGWLAWGVVVLCFGARFRAAARALAWLTVAAALTFTVTHLLAFVELGERGILDTRNMEALPAAAELMHAAIMWVLLARPSVARLFAIGSETGEIEPQ